MRVANSGLIDINAIVRFVWSARLERRWRAAWPSAAIGDRSMSPMHFAPELGWLGITHSPSFVGEPQCNGVIERFMRTLKEQCIWLHRFATLDEARAIIGAFIERYN